MTKQEKIERDLFQIINKAVRDGNESGRRNTGIHTLIEGAVREAILCFSSNGGVIRVDRELPEELYDDIEQLIEVNYYDEPNNGGGKLTKKLREAGYVAVEPLVKE